MRVIDRGRRSTSSMISNMGFSLDGANFEVIKDAFVQRHAQRLFGPARPWGIHPQDGVTIIGRFITNGVGSRLIQKIQKRGRDDFLAFWEISAEVR